MQRSVQKWMIASGFAVGCSILAFPALAHVSVVSTPAIANKTVVVELAVPHGCTVGEAHLDTTRIDIIIPPSITGIRPVFGEFGNATITSETADTGTMTTLSWAKPAHTALDTDSHYYSVKFRAKMPNAPFTKVALVTTQFCGEVSVSWDQVSSTEHEHGSTSIAGNPAPMLTIYPPRYAGWNQYTTVTNQHLHDMSLFNDADIVWWNNAAYSSNPVTLNMIENDANTSVLSEIHDNATFWVKY